MTVANNTITTIMHNDKQEVNQRKSWKKQQTWMTINQNMVAEELVAPKKN